MLFQLSEHSSPGEQRSGWEWDTGQGWTWCQGTSGVTDRMWWQGWDVVIRMGCGVLHVMRYPGWDMVVGR